MKDIKDNVVIQIEITNACNLSCANCSRLVGHHKKPFFMTLDEVRNAIKSLDGYKGKIGLMGGEPTLHPEFSEICDIYQEMVPDKRRRALWTDGFKWDQYKNKINETFDDDMISYNDHSKPSEGWHQPVLVSINDVVKDKKKMWQLIDNCWVQIRWSASITPKGAFFCEIAAALDHVLDGPGGWKVEPGWWKKTTKDYTKQKNFSCMNCSAALPMQSIPNNHHNFDYCSEEMHARLKSAGSPKLKDNRVKILGKIEAITYLDSVPKVEEGFRGFLDSHPDWRPSEYRTKAWHAPGEGGLSPKEVMKLQKSGSDGSLNDKEKGQITEVRLSDAYFTEASKKVIKSDIGEHVVIAIEKHIGDLHFSEESSLIELLSNVTPGGLTQREKDLVLKYATDPIYR